MEILLAPRAFSEVIAHDCQINGTDAPQPSQEDGN